MLLLESLDSWAYVNATVHIVRSYQAALMSA